MRESPSVEIPPTKKPAVNWLPWLVALALLGVTTALWRPIVVLLSMQDTALLRAEVARLGALAPAAFLGLSVVQIVGAPIPGYPVQFLGGALFGALLGGVYGVLGMVAGGVLAAWLARTLGRPFIEAHVAPQTLAKYERLAKLETLWVWVLILLTPLGDFPYYIAGLSRVKFSTLVLAILISRGPFTVLVAWAGATSVQAPPWVFWLLVAGVLALVAAGYVWRNRLSGWVDRHLLHRLQ
ncbi:MAG: TVP38/TMEM64 family protein [Anaerolineae bacterium]